MGEEVELNNKNLISHLAISKFYFEQFPQDKNCKKKDPFQVPKFYDSYFTAIESTFQIKSNPSLCQE